MFLAQLFVPLQKNCEMTTKLFYRVAGHCFSINIDGNDPLTRQLSQYAPFRVDAADVSTTVFELDVVEPSAFPSTVDYKEETSQDDDGSQISAGHVGDRPYFEFLLWGKRAARLLTDNTYTHAIVALDGDRLFGINNTAMVMYALSTSGKQTALFHSSVIGYRGRGYMFLGKSGTGKSTHSGLWLKYIDGTELLNDDNPVVRFIDGQPWVFGSPWSGKTPCYRNVQAPLGAIVRLSQAPYNKISPLKGIEAYAAVMPAISGMRWDRTLADGLHETENLLASRAKMFHLECLPDEAAARLCMETVTADKQEE